MATLQEYMNGSIRGIMAKAYAGVLSNPREAKFVYRLQKSFLKAESKRKKISAKEGVDIPPFLITSISTTCNLHCKGCYARANGIASDGTGKASLNADQWLSIFREAAELGINFSLLAGGEPLMRRDILEKVATVEDIIFPVFTNGTLIGTNYVSFFREHLNMIPVISIEGTRMGTDERRGAGVFERATRAMERLHAEDLFFGASLTVTTENAQLVTSDEFIDRLRALGCRILFYVEYVPTDPGTEHLAFQEADAAEMARILEQRREKYSDIIFLSFPGDEQELGGCLAAGRGFFHIGPDGSAEPCPFSPYSDSNVISTGLLEALRSPLFRKLRDIRLVGGEHHGGCTLWEHRSEVEALCATH